VLIDVFDSLDVVFAEVAASLDLNDDDEVFDAHHRGEAIV
jgi:hypothetical protein